MSFPKYPEYKDSGVEWLGEVPAHWHVEALKRRCRLSPSNVDKKSNEDESPVFLCNYTDVYYNERIVEGMGFMSATATAEQIEKFTLRAGDVIFTKDSETADDIAIAAYVPEDLPGVVCGYHLSMVRPGSSIYGSFIKRYFDSQPAKAYFAVSANGLTRVGLSQYATDNLPAPIPPLVEQNAIASFLDHETARIDALVEEQQRLIELLKEKRQAVISHAVTKGLDPDVPMKDSGVEWLGKIPAHWGISALRRHLQTGLSNGIFKKKESFGRGAPLINVQDAYSDNFTVRDDGLDRVSCSQNEIRNFGAKRGDLFFVRSSLKREGIAVAVMLDSDIKDCVFECHLVRARLDGERLGPRFATLVFNSQVYRDHLVKSSYTTTMTTISQEPILATPMPIPPVEEQVRISRFVGGEITKIDRLVEEAVISANYLSERRSALISAAVTGKIDVRGWQADQQSEQPELLMAAEERATYG